MVDYIDMSGFDGLTGDLEEYVKKQGYTLGKNAERLQRLLYAIQYCYIHGVATDSQTRQMNEKFKKQFKEALVKL